MRPPRPFVDRVEAGRELAAALRHWSGRSDVAVLGLPRGGVPVAREVAVALGAPLDVLVVRKLGVPGHAELAMGAIATGGGRVLNPGVVVSLGISAATIDEVVAREAVELARRQRLYRGDRQFPDLAAKVVIVVDDGLATGATMRAAVQAVRGPGPERPPERGPGPERPPERGPGPERPPERGPGPERLVVAVPVGASSTCRELARVADEVVCLLSPPRFDAVGRWFVDFAPPTDDEVRRLLDEG
ncbi:MAG: phosphoribosyltransferase [Acidimicrobiales bacterium]